MTATMTSDRLASLKARAKSGSADAQLQLGAHYLEEYRRTKDYDRKMRLKDEFLCWYEEAAEQGHVQAQVFLAKFYYYEAEEEQAFGWYHKAALAGHAQAQFQLGGMYENGLGVEKNKTRAARWYRKADVNANDTKYALERLQSNNDNTEEELMKTPEEWVAWLHGVASDCDVGASSQLGWLHYHGIGVERDFKKTFNTISDGAEQGDVLAQFDMACLYKKGIGVEQNLTKSVEWLRRVARQWYARSVERKIVEAQFLLGRAYWRGEGTNQNFKEAFYWYQKSANKEHPLAQRAVGYAYKLGKGVEKNLDQSNHWFFKSINSFNKNLANAVRFPHYNTAVWQYYLGEAFEIGNGVEKDVKKATELYLKAAEQGHAEAKTALKRIQPQK